MMDDRMTMRAGLMSVLGAAALASLTGCKPASQSDAEATVREPEVVETSEPVSIIREDIEPLETPEVLEPLEVRIGFGQSGAELSEDAVIALKELLASEQVADGGAITLRAHSDAGGSDAVNMRASEARGEAVRDWLIDNEIAEERIALIAFGEQNPTEPNALPDGSPNEAGRAANRRVDITVAVREGAVSEGASEPAQTSPSEE